MRNRESGRGSRGPLYETRITRIFVYETQITPDLLRALRVLPTAHRRHSRLRRERGVEHLLDHARAVRNGAGLRGRRLAAAEHLVGDVQRSKHRQAQ
jgi:hypothetical protein